MSDKFLPNVSVGDFAMDVLKSMAKDPNSLKPSLKTSTLESANVPDISKVNVSDKFVNLITEGKNPLALRKETPVKVSAENKLSALVSNLSTLISEAKSILEEISSAGSPGTTTTGNLGVSIKRKLKKRRFNARGI